MEKFSIEFSRSEHLETLLSHRMRMWMEIYPDMKTNNEAHTKLTREWLKEKLDDGSMIAILVRTHEGKIAGSGCILVQEDQPRPDSSMIKRPYLLSMFVEEEYRNQGAATLIVRSAISWAREHGYDRMTLHASEAGRALYEKMGFRQTNEMRLFL